MEEKKKSKLSLGMVLLFILVLAIIAVMFFLVYELHNQKMDALAEIYSLNEKVNNLQNQISNLDTENEPAIDESNNSKEVYKRREIKNMDEAEVAYYPEEYIILEEDTMYFSKDLSEKVLESTYTIDDEKNIQYKLLTETQDYAFYTASLFRIEEINGKMNIVIDNGENGIMYYEKMS